MSVDGWNRERRGGGGVLGRYWVSRLVHRFVSFWVTGILHSGICCFLNESFGGLVSEGEFRWDFGAGDLNIVGGLLSLIARSSLVSLAFWASAWGGFVEVCRGGVGWFEEAMSISTV